jgi:hypothetical protein
MSFEQNVSYQLPRLPSGAQYRGGVSCQQYESETLSYFFRRFLRLKAQAPEVFDEQVITEAIKALHIGLLHSYLVQEHPRTLEELYDNFRKFNRLEVLHFRKQDQ